MLASPAFAAGAGAPAAGGTAAIITSMAPLVFVFAIFYFLVFRPESRRRKAQAASLSAVKKGDTVVTGGGLIGKVTRVDEAEVEVELAPGMRVKAIKAMLAEVRVPAGSKPAND